jgi:cell division protease FtsH
MRILKTLFVFFNLNYLNELEESYKSKKMKNDNEYLFKLGIENKKYTNRDSFLRKKIKRYVQNNNITTAIILPQFNNIPLLINNVKQSVSEIKKTNSTRSERLNIQDLRKTSEHNNFKLENVNNYNFSKIGLDEDIKEEFLQILDMFENSQKYFEFGVKIVKGVLLHGNPGTGKTLLAKCLAGESNFSFIATSGSEFNEKYVGVGGQRIRELFNFAYENKPCIIFVDEIDGLARSRSSDGEISTGEKDTTLNQLLVCLDGFHEYKNVFLICATNRLDILDKALMRPGRIDRIINIPLPNKEARKKILEIHMQNKPINDTLLDDLVKITSGFTGSLIENLLNEVILQVLREKKENLFPLNHIKLFEEMKEQILIGRTEKKNISKESLKRIAIHEIGHMLVSLSCRTHQLPKKISVIPTSSNLGYTIFTTSEYDSELYTYEQLEEKVCVLLGGKVSEEMFYDTTSSGASHDLREASNFIHKMVIDFGMTDFIVTSPVYSEKYKEMIDSKIHNIFNSCYKNTQSKLKKVKPLIEHLTNVLIAKQVLEYDEIVQEILDFTRLETPILSGPQKENVTQLINLF